MADILLAAELENEMAEMAEGEGDDEQDYEDEMADVCFLLLLLYVIRIQTTQMQIYKLIQLSGHGGCLQKESPCWETKEEEGVEGCLFLLSIV